MRTNSFRRSTILAAVGVLAMLAPMAAVGGAEASSATPTASQTAVIPPPGSGTAHGYTALIRHASGPEDNHGKLVVLAPDGRSKTVGDVSDGAQVHDVSSNARTTVTGFSVKTGQELRLTIWDTETGKPTYLRVKDGSHAAVVKGGIVVSRWSGGAQLYSRAGKLVRTYTATGDTSLTASADGTQIVQGAGDKGVVVRDVATGTETHRVAVPSGRSWCFPTQQLDSSSFSMDCADPGAGAPGESTAYRAGFTGSVKTSRLVETADARVT